MGTVLTEIGDALETAHRRGIWHRDIKADNIMVAIRPDGRWQLKLTDFGVSKAVAGSRADVSRERETLDVEVPAATMFGHLVGTPAYMSPEQILGAPPDAHSDLWSLAVVAYEALVGRDPFRGDTMDELLSAISVRPHVPPRSLRPELPPAVDAFFAKALAKDPAERYASVAELVAAYHAALLPPPRRGRRIVVAAALLVAVGIIGFALVKTFGWFEPRQQRVNQSVPTVVLNVTASPVPERATAASASVPAPAPAPAPAPRALPLRPLPATPTSAPAPTPNPTPEPHVFDKSEIQ